MFRRAALVAASLLLICCGAWAANDAAAPKLDRARLEAYVRYAEGFTPTVQITIDDPVPSPFKGYFRVMVHLTAGAQKIDKVYYVTPDGQHFVSGNIWDLSETPFLDTLERLPTNGPSFGPENAKVTVVIFSDFQCPYCRQFAKTVRDNIPKKYPDQVRVIFEDFPIDSIHKWARAAAEDAQCIANQKPDAFWAFHDWIFEHQGEVNEGNVRDKIVDFAKTQNIDTAKLTSCVDGHATAALVKEEHEKGEELQVQQTPTVFVNGRTIGGAVPWATLDTVIQVELNRPKDIAEPAGQKCCEISIPGISKK